MGEADVDALIEQLWNAGGTDLLLTAGTDSAVARQRGALPAPAMRRSTAADTAAMADALFNDAQRSRSRDETRLLVLLARGRADPGQRIPPAGVGWVALRMIPRHIPS